MLLCILFIFSIYLFLINSFPSLLIFLSLLILLLLSSLLLLLLLFLLSFFFPVLLLYDIEFSALSTYIYLQYTYEYSGECFILLIKNYLILQCILFYFILICIISFNFLLLFHFVTFLFILFTNKANQGQDKKEKGGWFL